MSSSRHLAGRWARKFSNAFRGLWVGIKGQNSFVVYLPATAAVIAAAVSLGCGVTEWGLLLLCIAGVWVAELFNSSIESVARAVSSEQDPHLADALDVASGAVLAAVFGAVLVGTLILGNRLLPLILPAT